jgi:N6-L-threonylcarbamoyladenine synthase
LWTGINFAEALSKAWNVPLIGIDHMEGHVVSALLRRERTVDSLPLTEKPQPTSYKLQAFEFPLLALLISGGHTELVLEKEWFAYEHIGQTRDDAVGEAFDKVARLLDLPYPGGPEIQGAAARSRERGGGDIEFPRPMMQDATCDFSFSGLKTAVLYKLRSMERISEEDKEEIAEAFEDAARDVIVQKTGTALERTHAKALAVGGGVSANKEIREALTKLIANDFPDTFVFFPEPELTGDNAVMIGAAAYLRHADGQSGGSTLTAEGKRSLSGA